MIGLPFKTVLIANRGEIALRIVRACRHLGLRTVGICSEADRTALHLGMVDQVLCIGPAKASYLEIGRIMQAAALCQADAIHPGYGFLSENPEFAEAVEQSGLVFIGPSADVIRTMGDKIAARRRMRAIGLPCLPGSDDALPSDPDACAQICLEIGYPLILKAANGGGGRGMRILRHPAELLPALESARQEATQAFGRADIYAERYVEAPRHIEIQVLADRFGHAVWVGERDCSIQRRHQKLLEEAPAPCMNRAAIHALGEACAAACREIGYIGIGTFEFLYDTDEFFFIEMNTRLQVEHPVTEMVHGLDLVTEQIRVAAGLPLSASQEELYPRGHAIECRITAEKMGSFMPAPGTVRRWRPPGGAGIRVESHLYDGYVIPPFYDTLIAKIVAHGRTRDEALTRMRCALDEMEIEGIDTIAPLHQAIMRDPTFRAGGVSVTYIEDGSWNGEGKQ
ncbi:acetyl/propionyl/methylcrotonyl-CoA carboxylase subunit alpha [Gluconacetobacter sp. Hr-1-5]|uniref:acetyl-CoA carboxylase biotin carboxylase subunit n=1 Tax=Gluconacetobacter sp. Hr-1-5 TaxID=3395370 RepID=UPI003B52DE29